MTFHEQSGVWLAEQETRKIRRSSLSSYRSILRTHLTPTFGAIELADLAQINNKALRDLDA